MTYILFILVLLLRLVLAFSYDSYKVFCENKWYPLPVDPKFLFLMVQKMPKVYMKYLQTAKYHVKDSVNGH